MTAAGGDRGLRDGRDEECVVCALFRDVGDRRGIVGAVKRGDVAAAIVRPFISTDHLGRIPMSSVATPAPSTTEP
jgi:hypothetical protein